MKNTFNSMKASTEYPRTPSEIKRELRRLNITQSEGAEAIGKSEAMVSMALRRKAKSRPVLEALRRLIAARRKTNGR